MRRVVIWIAVNLFVFLIAGKYGLSQIDSINDTKNDSIECIKKNSTYKEYVIKGDKAQDQKKPYTEYYENALQPWRIAFNDCPQTTKNLYIDGIKLYKYLILKYGKLAKKDKENRAEYLTRAAECIDTIMLIYDRRIENFNQEGFVLGLKGYDLYNYKHKIPEAVEEAYGYMKKSVELLKHKTDPALLVVFMQTTIAQYKNEKLTQKDVVENYSTCMSHLELQLEHETRKSKIKKIKTSMDNVETLLTEGGDPDCETLVSIFEPKFKETPEDADLLKKITSLLDKMKCEDTRLFFDAAENLYKIEPSHKAAANLAKLSVKKEDFTKALSYFDEAIKLLKDSLTSTDDSTKLADYYSDAASILLSKQHRYAQVRNYCYEALKYRPNWGKPYLLVGNAYAASKNSCGSNAFEKKAVYWAAVDKFIKAKAVDPDVTEDANKFIGMYSSQYPNNEDAFFYGYTDGKPYTVGCWINEKTTVRTIKK